MWRLSRFTIVARAFKTVRSEFAPHRYHMGPSHGRKTLLADVPAS